LLRRYLDVDVFVVKSIDALFLQSADVAPYSAAPNWGGNAGQWETNSGVFVATPCKKIFDDMMRVGASDFVKARYYRSGTADQPLLNYYWCHHDVCCWCFHSCFD
jgi:hypothetical protein